LRPDDAKKKVIVVIQTLNLDGLDHILNIFALIRYSPCRSNTNVFWLFCLDPLVLLLPKLLIVPRPRKAEREIWKCRVSVRLSVRSSVRPFVRPLVRLSEICCWPI